MELEVTYDSARGKVLDACGPYFILCQARLCTSHCDHAHFIASNNGAANERLLINRFDLPCIP